MSRDFTWGTATSAYQVEGARRAGGKGDSIWDRFSDLGRLRDPGDEACDHYRRWPQDVALMSDLAEEASRFAYRFSISWPRVIPDGDGEVNQSGLDFYRRLIDALGEHDIQPMRLSITGIFPRPYRRREVGTGVRRSTPS